MVVIAFGDTASASRNMLTPFEEHPIVASASNKDFGRATSFGDLFRLFEAGITRTRSHCAIVFTKREEVAQVLSSRVPLAPSRQRTAMLWRSCAPNQPGAFSVHGRFAVDVHPEWDNAADDDANKAWLKDTFDPLQSLSTGHYINEFDREQRPLQTPLCFAPGNWDRLQEIRQNLDPGGVFVSFMGMV